MVQTVSLIRRRGLELLGSDDGDLLCILLVQLVRSR